MHDIIMHGLHGVCENKIEAYNFQRFHNLCKRAQDLGVSERADDIIEMSTSFEKSTYESRTAALTKRSPIKLISKILYCLRFTTCYKLVTSLFTAKILHKASKTESDPSNEFCFCGDEDTKNSFRKSAFPKWDCAKGDIASACMIFIACLLVFVFKFILYQWVIKLVVHVSRE